MTSADWIEAFLEMMAAERGAAANTLTAYGRDLEDAQAFLAANGSDLATADAAVIEAYFTKLGARGLAPSTAARRRSAVRQFYRFVLGETWRPDDPSRRVEAPRQGRPLPKVLSRAEMERLIEAAARTDDAGAARLAAMVELIYASGLRVSELTGPDPRGPGARSGLSDRQGQGRQGAACPAQRRGARGGEGLSRPSPLRSCPRA